MKPIRKMKWLMVATYASVVLALGGCAHPQLVDMGQNGTQVQSYLGEPAGKTPMPDGTVRWTYSDQPFGQQVWWLFLKDDKVVSLERGLQEKYFKDIRVGQWTEKDVWAFWGKCAQEYQFPLKDQHSWMYRFKDGTGMDMAVWVSFNPQGVVEEIDVTLDPWKHDGDDSWQ